jgi:hypothetical protein
MPYKNYNLENKKYINSKQFTDQTAIILKKSFPKVSTKDLP